MADINVKDIRIKAIDSKTANMFVKRHHYSGKVVQNSQLHFGAFYDDKLHGVMSFGASLDKRKTQGLVKGTGWNEFVELNRMAFDDFLPKNSESRSIAIAIRLIKKHAPQVKWIISFADATQCGDGTIYRASGFKLVAIKSNNQLFRLNDGRVFHKLSFENTRPTSIQKELRVKHDMEQSSVSKLLKAEGVEIIKGHQLKYVYFIDKSYQERLTVPVIPFGEIEKSGAKMYKGVSYAG